MGIDPAYEAALKPAAERKGAKNYADLKKQLEENKIKAALIIGENPMQDAKTSAYFHQLDFLAVIETAKTETVNFADAVLPGATYLETPGTRCNFEGKVQNFSKAINPVSGKTGYELLYELAKTFQLEAPETPESTHQQIEKNTTRKPRKNLNLPLEQKQNPKMRFRDQSNRRKRRIQTNPQNPSHHTHGQIQTRNAHHRNRTL